MLFAALRAAMPEAADDITDFLYKKGKQSLGETNEYPPDRLVRKMPPSSGSSSRSQAALLD